MTATALSVAIALGAAALPGAAEAHLAEVGTIRTISPHMEPVAVACPQGHAVTSTECQVLGLAGSRVLDVGVRDGVPTTSSSSIEGGTDVACMNAETCLAIGLTSDSAGVLEWFTHGHMSETVTFGHRLYLSGVACSATACVVAGQKYSPSSHIGMLTVVTPSVASPVVHPVAGTGELVGVACPTTTVCYAVGTTAIYSYLASGHGVSVTVTNGKIGPRHLAVGTSALVSISCGARASCWAVGNTQGRLGTVDWFVPVQGGTPGRRIAFPRYGSAIACYSSAQCLFGAGLSASGTGELDVLDNGIVVQRIGLPKFYASPVNAVDCPTATSCIATGAVTEGHSGTTNFYVGGVVTVRI